MPPSSKVRWRKTDSSIWLYNCPNHEELFLYYGRIYTVGRGYDYSVTNNLISNLKAPISSKQRLPYKKKAIDQFAQEVAQLLEQIGEPVVLVPMPPSKTSGHPEYDNRIEQVAQQVAQTINKVSWLPLLYRTRDVESHHGGGTQRNPNEIYKDLSLNESFTSSVDQNIPLFVLDDILTSGAHFSAARQRLQARFKDVEVGGLFWAKAEKAEDFYE